MKQGDNLVQKFTVESVVNNFLDSRTYIISVEDFKECYLIDCGDVEKIIEKGYNIKGVLLTHSHFDHIYGIPSLMKQFPECLIYTSEWGIKGLASDKLNFSRYHGNPVSFVGDNIHALHEGDRLELFKEVFVEVFETPGHDRSCLSYRIGNAVFSGDSFIPGVKVVATFPYSDREKAELSKQRILQMVVGKDLYPGHGVCYENFQI